MKTPLQILHKYFHHFNSERTRDLVVRAMEEYAKIYHENEVKKLQQNSVMQAEGSDGVKEATVGNSAAGQSGSDGFECEHYKSLNQQPFYCEHCKKTIT